MSTAPLILWCDLETTGTDELTDDIIEAAFVITDLELWEVAARQEVYRTDRSPASVAPAVLEMHRVNGLWNASYAANLTARHAMAEGTILAWLDEHVPRGDVLPMGGSGVSHFDRRFIRSTWRRLDRRLTFWAYDVGTVRRIARLAGVEHPAPAPKTHRAMDDIRAHIDEARWFVELLRIVGGTTHVDGGPVGQGGGGVDDPPPTRPTSWVREARAESLAWRAEHTAKGGA